MPKANAAVNWNEHNADIEQHEELAYRKALDEVLEVSADNDPNTNSRIQRLLEIGTLYLGMDSGMVASEMGDSLEIISVVGDMAKRHQAGAKVSLSGTGCSEVLNSDCVLAVHNIPNDSKYSELLKVPEHNKAYLGMQVVTANGPLGIICFFSSTAKDAPFSNQNKKLISVISNWIGSLLGNEEQLEFLSLQNNYYQSLFQTVPTMLMLCNKDGLILSASNRLSAVLGVDPNGIPGKKCQNYFASENSASLQAALIEGDVKQLPLTMLFSSGATLEVEYSSNIKNIGSMQGVRMIVLADVSERNQALRDVEEQNKHLALINQSLNQFAFMASHDLQEPLRKIQQFSHFLEEDLGEAMTEEGQYHLNVIVKSATRMSTLIKDLLKFSSAAKDKLTLADIDLNVLLEDVRSELELRIDESHASLIVENLPTISGDISLVRQLLINLIGNSIKYRDCSRTPIITVASQSKNDKLSITISDNGIGFEQSSAAKAFEPFNRLHKDKRFKGNGIGLSICATVCEKHNWDLSVQSRPGEGSVFSITLN